MKNIYIYHYKVGTQKQYSMKRIIISTLVCMLCTLAAFGQAKKDNTMSSANKTLVAYFSATGTTERVAKMIASTTSGDLFEITPVKTYSDADLDWTNPNSRCCKENDDPSSRPEFVKTKEDLTDYDIIYLGFPNWWNGAPRIVNTFIENYDLKGKIVIPFMTSGGSGISNSMKTFRAEYPDIKWKEGKVLNNASLKEIKNWVQ